MRLAEEETKRHKENKQSCERESFEKSMVIERERQEIIKNCKVMEIKLAESEYKLREAQKLILALKPKE